MTPRSLIMDMFADYARHRSGEIGALALTGLLADFDIADASARMTLSRMSKEGWLDRRRQGRRSFYSMTPRLRLLIETSESRILERRRDPWAGAWQMVLYSVPEAERALRDRVRTEVEWLGFGPLSPGAWISPHDHTDGLASLTVESDAARIDLFELRTGEIGRDRALARQCWNLDDLHEQYIVSLRDFQARIAALRAGAITDQEAFTERVRLIASYRKIPFEDPDLPSELLPADWCGREAHTSFLELRELLRPGAFAYFDACCEA